MKSLRKEAAKKDEQIAALSQSEKELKARLEVSACVHVCMMHIFNLLYAYMYMCM